MRLLGWMLAVVLASVAAATPDGRAAPPGTTAFACKTQDLATVMEPSGRIALVEYEFHSDGVAHPTGRVFASIDASTRTVNPVCSRVRTWRPRAHYSGFAGPWPRSVESRMFCTQSNDGTLRFEIVPLLTSRHRLRGYRVLVKRNGLTVVDGSITLRGGGISYDPGHCDRNIWP
jgi:hypothetical protein